MGEKSDKDTWDKLQAVGALLSGIAVPLLLFLLTNQAERLQKAAVASAAERENSARERELAQGELSVRVAQAGIIPSLIDGLLSEDPQRRKVATTAILIALPEDGPRLVRELAEITKDPEVHSYATEALKTRKDDLVTNLYASDAETRKSAARALAQGWRNDRELPKRLVESAKANNANQNGVFNSVVVLGSLSKDALDANRADVEKFLTSASTQGDKTASEAARVRAKLNAAE